MPVRDFKDPRGNAWRVWDVIPEQSTIGAVVVRHVPVSLASGWLCFESGEEKRRLAPIPSEWEARSDSDLWILCQTAMNPAYVPEQSTGGVWDGRDRRQTTAPLFRTNRPR